MKINRYLIIGIIVTCMALYYWIEIGRSTWVKVPMLYHFTFRLFIHADILWTVGGLLSLIKGIRKLRE